MQLTYACVLTAALSIWPVALFAEQAVLSGAGFDEVLSRESVLSNALRSPGGDGKRQLNVRLIVERAELEPRLGEYQFDALDARIELYKRLAGVRPYIDIRGLPADADSLPAVGSFVRNLASRYGGSVSGYIFGVSAAASAPDRPAPLAFAFMAKTIAVNVRAGDQNAAFVLGGIRALDVEWLRSLYREDIAAYVDAIGLVEAPGNTGIMAVIDEHDPGSAVVILGIDLGDTLSQVHARFIEAHLDLLGSRITGATYQASTAAVEALAPHLLALSDLLDQHLIALDEATVRLQLVRSGRNVTDSVRHRLLFGTSTLTNYFVYSNSNGPLELVLAEATGTRPVIRDVVANTRRPVPAFVHDSATGTARIGLPSATSPLVVDWGRSEETYSAQAVVSAAILPSVAEIIARHQQAQARQDSLYSTYVADATMEQHFRTSAADAGFDVVTENRFFVEGKNTEWVELSFRLNGTRWGANRPAFPLLQAEKVLSLPLDLRLNADYRYTLERLDEVGGQPCYVVRFDPVANQQSLYRGSVCIDGVTYLKSKVQTVQSQLEPPVVSSEEVHYFTDVVTPDGRDVRLLTRLVGRQIILIAGRNLLVEREIRFENFQLDKPDFESLREAARTSDQIMYRDTEKGVRYLVKKGGDRIVQDEMTQSATAAMLGVTYDPSYDFPLPLVGVNYIDFEFLGKDNQLAVLFGGVLALVNVQRPNLVGRRVDGSLDLFAIAVKGNDRSYGLSGERTGERVRTLPFSTGINLGFRMTEFHKLLGTYQFRYDWYSADELTAPAFRAPLSTMTNGVGLSWEWKQSGYSAVAGVAAYQRAGWELWGDPNDYSDGQKDYRKYTASISKDLFFGLHKVHMNAAYYGGHDLDRFSSYQFGFFDDHRVRGVPSSGVRFGDLAMLRGSYSFNLFNLYGLDVLIDRAIGRDWRPGSEWQALTGLGIGFTLRGPRNTLIRADWGKSFLPPQYKEPGSVVFQLQLLKPL